MLNLDTCTGCRACEQVCPKDCISITPDDEGFLIPNIDENICIKCKICYKICPQNKSVKKSEVCDVFAVKYKNKNNLIHSASGGAFYGIAEYVLNNNGIVFGAAYNDNLQVEHIHIYDIENLKLLQGSKYVQSDTKNTFTKVKKFLIQNRLVLYSGTPCQIAGLKYFLGKEYENLLTVDLICHGVPSPKLFKKYLEWYEMRNNTKIKNYNFRSKENDEWTYQAKISTEEKHRFINGNVDPYYSNFLECNTYRECCYSCQYSTRNRIGDITLGDYWGIEKEHRGFDIKMGVSCVIINTKKGIDIFNSIKHNYDYVESSFEKVAKHNHNLYRPTSRGKRRNNIYRDINNLSADKFIKQNLKVGLKLKKRIINLLPIKIKNKLKSIKNKF